MRLAYRRACSRKATLETLKVARRFRAIIQLVTSYPLFIYRCPGCGRFHLTHCGGEDGI